MKDSHTLIRGYIQDVQMQIIKLQINMVIFILTEVAGYKQDGFETAAADGTIQMIKRAA